MFVFVSFYESMYMVIQFIEQRDEVRDQRSDKTIIIEDPVLM